MRAVGDDVDKAMSLCCEQWECKRVSSRTILFRTWPIVGRGVQWNNWSWLDSKSLRRPIMNKWCWSFSQYLWNFIVFEAPIRKRADWSTKTRIRANAVWHHKSKCSMYILDLNSLVESKWPNFRLVDGVDKLRNHVIILMIGSFPIFKSWDKGIISLILFLGRCFMISGKIISNPVTLEEAAHSLSWKSVIILIKKYLNWMDDMILYHLGMSNVKAKGKFEISMKNRVESNQRSMTYAINVTR